MANDRYGTIDHIQGLIDADKPLDRNEIRKTLLMIARDALEHQWKGEPQPQHNAAVKAIELVSRVEQHIGAEAKPTRLSRAVVERRLSRAGLSVVSTNGRSA